MSPHPGTSLAVTAPRAAPAFHPAALSRYRLGLRIKWNFHLVGSIRAPPDVLALTDRHDRTAAWDEAGAAVVVLDVRPGDHPAGVEHAHALEAGESPADRASVSELRDDSVGSPSTTLITRAPSGPFAAPRARCPRSP